MEKKLIAIVAISNYQEGTTVGMYTYIYHKQITCAQDDHNKYKHWECSTGNVILAYTLNPSHIPGKPRRLLHTHRGI